MHHRLIYLLFIAVFLSSGVWAQSDINHIVSVPIVKNLQADGRLANEKRVPIMVMFSSEDCPHCHAVIEEFLEPMIKSGEYVDNVIIRKLEIDGSDIITDFHGKRMSMETFTQHYKVNFTPYIKFFDSNGNELVKPIIGITSGDFYGQFLDDAIKQAASKLRK